MNLVSFYSDTLKSAVPEVAMGQFTASQFRPDEWAQLAKDAGDEIYEIPTAMHHDGFGSYLTGSIECFYC